jgi:hypothetical protein
MGREDLLVGGLSFPFLPFVLEITMRLQKLDLAEVSLTLIIAVVFATITLWFW